MSILDNVFLINLDNRKDRLLFMDYKLQELGINYTRIPAVLGSNHSDEYNNYMKQFTNPTGVHIINSLGSYGLLLTYKNFVTPLYKKNKYITVFEDDVFFHKDFNILIKKYEDIIENYDVIWLGCQQVKWTSNMISEYSKLGYYTTRFDRYKPFGTFCIVYSPKFLKILNNELNLNWDTKNIRNIDIYISIILQKYSLKAICINSSLGLPQVFESDNMGPRDIHKMCEGRKWDLSLYKYCKTTAYFCDMYKNKIINNEVLDEIDEQTLKNLITEKPLHFQSIENKN